MTTSLAGGRSAPLPARLLALAVLLAAGLLTAGCSDVESVDSIPERPVTPSYDLPALSEDELVSLVRESYRFTDLETYRAILHADYRFKFQQYDIDILGLPSDHLTRAEEEDVAENMFSGTPSPSSGEAAISGITWSLLEGNGTWEDSQNPEFPGTRRRLYAVEFAIERPGAPTIVIHGEQEFYAAGRDTVLPDEGPVTVWTLRGQVDRTVEGQARGLAPGTWGAVKAMYRS